MRYRNLFFFQKTREGGGGGRTPATLLQQRCVFIVMQISSRNLGQVQVHPVLVARTETRMSSLLLTALLARSAIPELVLRRGFFHVS